MFDTCESLYRDLEKVQSKLRGECGNDIFKNKACSKLGQEQHINRKMDKACKLNGLSGLGYYTRSSSGSGLSSIVLLAAAAGFIWWMMKKPSEAKAAVVPPVFLPPSQNTVTVR